MADTKTQEKIPLLSPSSVYKKEKGDLSWLNLFWQRFQIWLLQHPNNILSWFIIPILQIIQGFPHAKDHHKLPIMRERFGPNFCVGGQVCLSDFETISKALTSPQARTFGLVTVPLAPDALPMINKGERNLFLLALSDHGAGGDGTHECVRKAITDMLFTEEAKARRRDETAKKLFDQVAKDYKTDLQNGSTEPFFKDFHRGLNMFFIKYLHYVLFNLDPDNESNTKKFMKLYYESVVLMYWVKVVGKGLSTFNVNGARDWTKMIDEVVEIYKESPVVTPFEEGKDEYKNLTKHEFAHCLIPLMGIAALGGNKHLSHTALGFETLPTYKGHENLSKFDVTTIWDKLDLDNREELEKYLFECGRLRNPVLGTHRVAESDFTTNIAGTNYTFPKGTVITIPIVLGMTDENVWGSSTYQFDHNRKNLCPFVMIFNSVGEKSAGRICPGRGLALEMLTELVRVTGKMRR